MGEGGGDGGRGREGGRKEGGGIGKEKQNLHQGGLTIIMIWNNNYIYIYIYESISQCSNVRTVFNMYYHNFINLVTATDKGQRGT
jgi:hypothetical protein